MEIYIKLTDSDNCTAAWFTDTGTEMYLVDGDELFAESSITGEIYARGTPFKSVVAAKAAAKEARINAIFDGMVDPKVSYWRMKSGKLIETKFTRDNKIKN